MGNEQSQFSEGGGTFNNGAGEPYGFQVLRNNNPNLSTIDPWFDFVCGINGRQIDDPNPILFQQEVWNCVAGKGGSGAVTLGVWCAKGQRLRDVVVPLAWYIPSNNTAATTPADSPYATSTGISSATGGLSLGLTLQWTPLSHSLSVWHIITIAPDSPSDLAGLLQQEDYILPIPPQPSPALNNYVFTLKNESDLGQLVEAYVGRKLALWVYNHEANVVREVEIEPRRGWGGEGVVGCVLGFGALHRLPVPVGEGGVVGPGGVLFDGSEQQQQLGARMGYGGYGADSGGFPPIDGSGLYQPPPPSISSMGEGGGGQYYIPALQAPPPSISAHGGRNSPLPRPGSAASTHTITSPPPPQTSIHARTKARRALHHHHHQSAHPGMDEYMREQEIASLEADRPGSGMGARTGSPLPPPPKGGIPPPPRRGVSSGSGTGAVEEGEGKPKEGGE